VVCIFCTATRSKSIASKLRDSDAYSVVECTRCHLVQLTPVPRVAADQKFYDEGLQAKNIGLSLHITNLKRKQLPDVKRRAEWVMPHCKPGAKVLDIGSGYGFFVEELRKRGLKPTGMEISKTSRAIAKKVTSVNILNINLIKDSFHRAYDVITMFHVLEHISEPVKFLIKVRTLLSTRGKLFVEVPNRDDLMLKHSRAYRDFYWQRAHISYFNENTLLMVMRKSGFKTIRVSMAQRYGIENCMTWLIAGKPQLERPSLSVRGATAQHYGWLEKFYKDSLVKTKKADTILAVAEA